MNIEDIDGFGDAECKYKLIETYNTLIKVYEKSEEYEACQDFLNKIKDIDNHSPQVIKDTLKRVLVLMSMKNL